MSERSEAVGPFIPTGPVDYVRYKPATGEITLAASLPAHIFHQYVGANPEPYILGKGSIGDHYVDTATKEIRRKTQGVAVVDGTTLRNLPVPCKIQIGQETAEGALLYDPDGFYDVLDGIAELTFTVPGKYQVWVSSAPFYTQVLTVVA